MKKLVLALSIMLACILVGGHAADAFDQTTIQDGLNQPRGSDYLISTNRSFFVERFAGKLWSVNMNDLSSAVLGTGYDGPMDIAVSTDGRNAYVIENGNGGTLLRVNLARADRARATVICTNIGGASSHILTQIALDEAHNCAYVIQNTGYGVIWRINLTDGSKVAVLTDTYALFGAAPGGLLLNKDSTFAYFTILGDNGRVVRLNLSNGATDVLVEGLTNPNYLDWANSNESVILLAHAGQISSINISQAPLTLNPLVTGLNYNTKSVRRISDDSLLVSAFGSVYHIGLSPFTPAGPIILGIGHVPFDRIVAGYADTTVDPGIPIQVKDAPFGGTLDLMINHERAYAAPMNARWYKVLVDGVEPKQGWSDYLWSSAANRFLVETVHPDASGFYSVHRPDAIWYEHWLGYRLNTSGLSNGLHTITVKLYRSDRRTLAGPSASLRVKIDNRWPTAMISKIFHDGDEVPACAMVAEGSNLFTFKITASDPDQHLSSWSLLAFWGENQSTVVSSDSYSAHLPGPAWPGIVDTIVPIKPWPAIETCCAHTFHLSVWDRTIDGHNYIHWSGYNKSITIMTGCPPCQK